MQVITVKFQEEVLKNIDDNIGKHNFNSRTEFLREAVRDKLAELSKNDLIEEFLKFRGKAKNKTTYPDNRKTKKKISEELITELEKRFT